MFGVGIYSCDEIDICVGLVVDDGVVLVCVVIWCLGVELWGGVSRVVLKFGVGVEFVVIVVEVEN